MWYRVHTKCLKTLEYNKILNILSNYCKTYVGKDRVLDLKPSFNKLDVESSLESTKEAISLIYRKSGIPLSDFPNISLSIKNLESSSVLSCLSLLNIARFLKISREVKTYFLSDELDMESYTRLSDYFDCIYTNKSIEDKLFSVILDENVIADEASSKLSSIRRQKKRLEQDIRDKLTNFIHSSANSKYIMEPIVTIRNDRYVVPIKEECRSFVKGFIHDISSSGSTVFIEPINVFELNNELASLQVEEEVEIEKILSELSNLLYPYPELLSNNIDILGDLDLIFAKATYSIQIDGVLPKINDCKYINLIAARHPLISPNIVVPIDISIGKDYSALVITGPNTGGKTVSLKTTGLLLLMAYSGIFIPAKENSSIYVFDSIFADIGDEQSIQENLSTFSSHISNIVDIIKSVTSKSLILLDELGSGTDPIEGAGLAISILKYFFDLGSITLSTTHYQELKNYCLTEPGFKNASFEFDLDNLRPTYKLLIGIPGKSNAFAISRKLGLDSKILDYASSLIANDNISIEELMKNIYNEKIEIEKEKEAIEKNSRQIETLRKSLENEQNRTNDRKDKILNDAKEEAKQILLSAKHKANSAIAKLNSKSVSTTAANNIRNEINEELKGVSTTSNVLNLDTLKAFNEKFNLKNSTLNVSSSKPGKYSASNVHSSNTLSGKLDAGNVTFSKGNNFKAQNVSPEINVIGMNISEATFLIDKYLDDCAIAKLSSVRIVHGKGTGKLREGIHQFLKKNPHVQSFRMGTFGEGEMGVTVVYLK